ncbi:amino acid ABC transporter membrane protein 2 (PAAT family) [Herbihabitans rhizosphaerae]|uniref:Amino acid ABC transporter membrane protein 2 (PAAT family) n=1 Tax=Herbihabitans rhizosphaerae TaxID=1872711 RepID=A0A4Q7KCY5_9PSEU|nr:amino acid ABC transporter permease [Herbihabitans rhizosphaerae]RZS30556.1 amino acid ABC transporter membrane protein 2 (PAAT family) [Herbihabitans rhizosphaerae]
MSAPSVLYDAPGPKAKARNHGYTAAFIVVIGAIAWYVISELLDSGQLDWPRWEPFVNGSGVWTAYILPGLQNTLIAAALAIVIALPLGAILGIARLSQHLWIRAIAGTIVEFFRAVPVLILMVFARVIYFEFTTLPEENLALFSVVTGLVLYNASVLAEVFRAGILSLPKGQTEAASALGLRKTQLMTLILLPQAITVMLPAIVSQLVVTLKDTALGGAILSFPDLLDSVGKITANFGSNVIASFVIIAAIYIMINSLLTWFAGWLERKLAKRKKAPKAKPIHIATETGAGASMDMGGGGDSGSD